MRECDSSRLFQITAFVLGFKVYQVLQSFFKSGVFVFYSPLALLSSKPDILGACLPNAKNCGLGSSKWGLHLFRKNSQWWLSSCLWVTSQGVWVLIILKLCLSHPSVRVPLLYIFTCGKSFWNSSGHSHRWLLCKQVELSRAHGRGGARVLLLYHLGHHQQGFRQSSPNKATVKPIKVNVLKMSLPRYIVTYLFHTNTDMRKIFPLSGKC